MKKAYMVWDVNGYEPGTVIAFAETAGKAKVAASFDDIFEDTPYEDLRARRDKRYDKYATKNRDRFDWYNEKDRRILVETGWSCYEPQSWECKECSCKDVCEGAIKDEECIS